MQDLPIISRQASDLAASATDLANKIKDIAITNIDNVEVGTDPFIFAMTIFTLSCFVGYYVVWKVTPSLHTPLMSVTNAISGIIIIGSMIAASPSEFSASALIGYIASFLAAINIFGGFIVTERMLEMFKKKPKK